MTHGTHAAYAKARCRCTDCKTAESAYRQQLARRARPVNIDDLPVTCWCEQGYVWVPPADVRNGQTRSCGLRACTQEVDA